MSNIISFDNEQRIKEKAEKEGWEEDDEVMAELKMGDFSEIEQGFERIMYGMLQISNATGVDVPDWEQIC